MKVLCIYCCGGMGREIADLSYRIMNWDNIIFVDDNIINRVVDGIKVYTFEEVLEEYDKDSLDFIVTAGEPFLRELLSEKLLNNGIKCISIIDPNFNLSKTSSVMDGTIIHTGATITCNVHIGLGCLINKHAVIGHDVIVGDYSVISPNVTIGGNTNIGKACYLGSGAIIRNCIKIGDNSIIGMGAVVLCDVLENSVMMGNPAKFIRNNDEKRVFKT